MPFCRALRLRLRLAAQNRGFRVICAIIALMLFIAVCSLAAPASRYLRTLATEIAISNATDLVTSVVNETINKKMSEGRFDYDYFVTLQRDEDGAVTAISANMTRINTLASEILRDIISSTAGGGIDIGVPVGNLTGSALLIGRGPKIPIKVLMLTSSYADFRNDLSSAGINQTRHQIILELRIEVDILMPWEIRSGSVDSEVLIAETVIVGSVPNTYLSYNSQ